MIIIEKINIKNGYLLIFKIVFTVILIILLYIICKYIIISNKIYSTIKENYKNMSIFYVDKGYTSSGAYIAHGGGINDFTYTNSYEAVLDSIKKGFEFIELDLLETKDGDIIAGHDWKYFKRSIGKIDYSDDPLSIKDIYNAKINNKYSILTSKLICNIMKKYENFILITDKINNFYLLKEKIPFLDRIIVEVFSVGSYYDAINCGIKYPAYSVFNMKRLKRAVRYKFPIIIVDAKMLEHSESLNIIQKLHDSHITIFIYYNKFKKKDDINFLKRYLGKTFSKVYTDKWSPMDILK